MRSTGVLVDAWHAIRRNAETSQTASTKQDAREFGNDLPRNIRRIQDRLRRGYHFEKAHGATPSKGPGKTGKRPIVVAPLADRIVQRAILDVLQDATELAAVQEVLATPTSIGGIRGRGVDCAIKLFDERYSAGDRYVAGSDISGFFTKIPRDQVVDFVRKQTPDTEFVDLLERALTVELKNADTLGPEERKLFPTGADGVAQGCPLSALAGNIILKDFDRAMNDRARGITCIRYIDDFIITGRSSANVTKAMESAKAHLTALKMEIYDPVKHPGKAFAGKIGEPHVFLGYEIVPGSYSPAPSACQSLITGIEALVQAGKATIRKALKGKPLNSRDRGYAQTLTAVNHTVRGWRGSFRSSVGARKFKEVDLTIERRLGDFETFFRTKTVGVKSSDRRRALGVSLLSED